MKPKREEGDDRVMWRMRPLLTNRRGEIEACGSWVYNEYDADVTDMIGDIGQSYEVQRVKITAEQWNSMPEFEGW